MRGARLPGDRHGETTVLNSLGIDQYYQERHPEALDYLRQAQALHTALGDWNHASLVLNNIGHILLRLNRPDEALDHLKQGLAIRPENDDQHRRGTAENTLGDTYLELGRFSEALDHYRRARAALEDIAREDTAYVTALCGPGRAPPSAAPTRPARPG